MVAATLPPLVEVTVTVASSRPEPVGFKLTEKVQDWVGCNVGPQSRAAITKSEASAPPMLYGHPAGFHAGGARRCIGHGEGHRCPTRLVGRGAVGLPDSGVSKAHGEGCACIGWWRLTTGAFP